MNLLYSYQERWRDVPDETRQPSSDMVPIHIDERKEYTKPFCPSAEGLLFCIDWCIIAFGRR